MHTQTTVALMGLGLMGTGMATQLLRKGFDVTVYNRTPEKAEALRPLGAKVATAPAEAAKGAQFIISMVADDVASRGVWVGADGALGSAMPGAVLIECSTLSVAWVRELSALAKDCDCELLDAPVTGTKPHAAAGELVFLAGGSNEAVARAQPLFSAMGRQTQHLGPIGSGAMLKLINNFVCGVQAVALAEAIALLERTDLDRDKALAVLTDGAPGSPLVKALSKRMTVPDFTPNFVLKLMMKDMKYAIEEGRSHSVALATGAAALGVMRRANEAGYGERDFSAVVEVLRT
jgi:3-hydroxyisobutyrate dehydrogenase